MAENKTDPQNVLKRLGRVLALTRLGLIAESATHSFWPLWSLVFCVAAALMLGVQDTLVLEVIWVLAVGLAAIALTLLVFGLRRFRIASRDDALARLDATLPGRPLQALQDHPASGTEDAGTQALWQAHQARMARNAQGAQAVHPDLRIARLDPFGLRYIAVLALSVALLFGSFSRVASVGELIAGGQETLSGPSWEGWIEPPAYSGKPALYLPDLPEGALELTQGSRIILRLYGEVGALTVAETVSGRTDHIPSAADPEQDFTIFQSGDLEIEGVGGRHWKVSMIADSAPVVSIMGPAEVSGRGEFTMPFMAVDDYAVTGGQATISLDLSMIERRFGLMLDPETLMPITLGLPLPISGSRAVFEEVLIEDLSKHPWAHLPVRVFLSVEDAKGQTGASEVIETILPARRFFDPMAAAVIELRRDLLWSRENAPRVAQLIRAISHHPEEGVFDKETTYLRMRVILRQLENMIPYGVTVAQRDDLAEALWSLALLLEEGDLGDVLARMEQARERLAEAMKNGASDEEIARLMQDLREATQDYLRELARRDPPSDGEDRQSSENTTKLNQDDLQRMMDRIQELMEQGRMAEAMQALDEFQRMMENMQVTQGGTDGEQSPGEQAMEELNDTLRKQQGLSDQAFRELQEQFNPNANKGQSQNNQGSNGGDGRGQSHDGTGQGLGEGQDGQTGQQQRQGQQGQSGLADRQQALRQQLETLQGQLPGGGTPEGDAVAEALGRAGDAMDQAEDALRDQNNAAAIDQQAQAMDALRDGMRNLGEAMAKQQGQGAQGQQQANENMSDPLGRTPGPNGGANPDGQLSQGEDVYRQARELLDEIRRRGEETQRPEAERGYLRRLLDRF